MGLSNIEYASLLEMLNSSSKTMTKSLMSLKSNDIIKAQILDITPESVKLKLADNSVINARSLVIPEAKIGQTAQFLVKGNNNGQIELEFFKGTATNVPESLAKNILNSFEAAVNKQNIQVVSAMLENNIPITGENINKALFFRYSLLENDMTDTIFLLKENMPASKETIENFNNITQNPDLLKDEIISLAQNIIKMPEGSEKSYILNFLGIKEISENSEESAGKKITSFKNFNIDEKSNIIYNKIIKKFLIDNKDLAKADNIQKKLNETESAVNQFKDIKDLNVSQNAKSIESIIEFIKNIDTTKLYLQIPVIINNNKESCELYIFKNPKKNLKDGSNSKILLSLNTTNLGKTEIYIEKNSSNLSFQFRLENPNTIKLIKNNIKKLSMLLKEKKFNLISVSYINKDEKFEIQKKDDSIKEQKQRFSFDMHV